MGQDASAIRHEIEATRSRMADIVESIGEKFDIPSRVRADVGPREVMTTGIVGGALSNTVAPNISAQNGYAPMTALALGFEAVTAQR